VSGVTRASKEATTTSAAKSGVEALPSNAVLVVPLEKLPEIAAALSKQGSDGLVKKQVSLASNVPVQKHLQAQNESSATSSKPAPAPYNASGAPETNAGGQKQLKVTGKPSNGSSSLANGTITAKSTNQSVPEVLATSSKVEKPDQEKKPNERTGVASNRSVPSLVSSATKHQIVKAATPLTPLRGKSAANLALQAQAKAAVKKTGLVTKGVASNAALSDSAKATQVSTETRKEKKKYDGFLSGFVS
jgi:hypothetical protein